MNGDPRRLVECGGGLEALLVERLGDVDPPDGAADQLWERTQRVIGAAGAVGVAGALAVHGSEAAQAGVAGAAGKLLGLASIKWVAVGVVAASAVGLGTHWVVRPSPDSTDPVAVPGVGAAGPGAAPAAIATPPSSDEALEGEAELDDGHAEAAAPSAQRGRAPRVPRDPASVKSTPRRSGLEAESALLGQARAKARAGDAVGALADVERLRARFPDGQLRQERELVAIEALKLRGRNEAAQQRAEAFADEFPDSPYTGRVNGEPAQSP